MNNSSFVSDEDLRKEAEIWVERMKKFDKNHGITTRKIPTVEEVFQKLREKADLDFTKGEDSLRRAVMARFVLSILAVEAAMDFV